MSSFRQFELRWIRDSLGTLTVVQDALPFVIRRIFWITDADGKTRGGHRHHVTRQALVAVAGSIDIYLDDGRQQVTVRLSDPTRCLIVEPDDWHTMRFGSGAVLLVMASHLYDRADYIDEPYRTGP
jgi:hypothetical protein